MNQAWTFSRWLRLRCPHCGADTFKAGTFRTAKACSACGQVFDRGEGFNAGAIYPFYAGAAVLGGLVLVLATLGLGWSFEKGMALGVFAVLLASPWLFWYSRLAFLYTDHRFFNEGA